MPFNTDIPGWMDPVDLAILARLATKVPPDGEIVEVGSYLGRSAWALSKSCHPTVKVHCIDLWEDLPQENTEYPVRPTLKAFLEYVKDCPNITALKGGSTTIDWPVEKKADLIFIDADHTSPQIDADLAFWEQRLKPDGVIAGHDLNPISWPDVCRAVIRLCEKMKKPLKAFQNGYIWAIEMHPKEPQGDEFVITPDLLEIWKVVLKM